MFHFKVKIGSPSNYITSKYFERNLKNLENSYCDLGANEKS